MPAIRGAQVVLEGYARNLARGSVGKSLVDNITAMDMLKTSGLVADGYTANGTSRTGQQPYDLVIAQFPHEPVAAWELPAPLLQLSLSLGSLPTSDAGLSPGALWLNGSFLCVKT